MSQEPNRRGVGRGRRMAVDSGVGGSIPATIASSAAAAASIATVSSFSSVDTGIGRGRGRGGGRLDAVPEPRDAEVSSVISTPETEPEELEKLVKETASLKIIDLVQRPGFGVTGLKGSVFANYFEVAMKKELSVLQYHVDITHTKLKLTRDEKRIIFMQCVDNNQGIFTDRYAVAYDGDHICFSLDRLKFPNREFATKINIRLLRMEKPEEMDVKFQLVGVVHVSMRNVKPATPNDRYTTPMHFLDILFRQQRSCVSTEMSQYWYPFASTVYRIPEQSGTDLTCGRTIWQGLFGACHVGQNFVPYINFDVSHSGFYKPQTMIHFIIDILNDKFSDRRSGPMFKVNDLNAHTKLNPSWVQAINKEIRTLKILTDVRRSNGETVVREYRINGMVAETALTHTFDQRVADGQTQKISVNDYFKQRYGQLKFPNLNLLHVGAKNKATFIPLEHCRVAPNQRVAKKLTPDQLNIMIKAAAINAPNRRDKIRDLVNQSGFNNDPWLQKFGVRINPEMKQTEARLLPPPKIQYGGGPRSIVEPRDGVWDCRNQRFFVPASCDKIGALVMDDRDHEMYKAFFDFLLRTCAEYGMRVPPNINLNAVRAISPNATSEIEAKITELVNMGATFIIVTLPQKSSVFYSEVKRVAEVIKGVMTQCVVKNNIAKTMQKMDRMTTSNIALKINTKLGGINSKTQADALVQKVLFDESTMVLGIDVTHPSPLEHKAPSIASVVGNLDDSFMRYGATVRVQKHRRESMVYLQEPIRERLIEYFTSNQRENERREKAGQQQKVDCKPRRLIIFRDGVAEGQFQEVLREEMTGIREACKQLGADYKPKITVIVAQKRHHARFFPTSQQASCGRAMNVRPGTVVDKDITHPEQFEFYLCSHFGIQGTSRPIRYHVLYDDNNFSADHIQVMTYYMCHLYARCTRTVSIPAPIYYADLACRRARAHLYDKIADFGSDTMSTVSGTQGETKSGVSEDELIRSSTVADGLKMRMYFA